MPTHRFFYALKPPAQQRALIATHHDGFDHAESRVSNDRQHVTLAITHDYDHHPAIVEDWLMEQGDEIASAPFALSLDRLSASNRSVALRPSHRPAALSELHRQLDVRLRSRAQRRNGWAFNPHLTLLYRKDRPFERRIPAIDWNVAEFALIHSVVGETRHIELKRWHLDARQGELF